MPQTQQDVHDLTGRYSTLSGLIPMRDKTTFYQREIDIRPPPTFVEVERRCAIEGWHASNHLRAIVRPSGVDFSRIDETVIIISEGANVTIQFQIHDDEFRFLQNARMNEQHDRVAMSSAARRATIDNTVHGVILQRADHRRYMIVFEVFAQLLAFARRRENRSPFRTETRPSRRRRGRMVEFTRERLRTEAGRTDAVQVGVAGELMVSESKMFCNEESVGRSFEEALCCSPDIPWSQSLCEQRPISCQP